MNNCIRGTGTPDRNGYLRARHPVTGAQTYQHRNSYEAAYGPVPFGHVVHHRCENKQCINPAHLVALTHAEHRAEHARMARELVAA